MKSFQVVVLLCEVVVFTNTDHSSSGKTSSRPVCRNVTTQQASSNKVNLCNPGKDAIACAADLVARLKWRNVAIVTNQNETANAMFQSQSVLNMSTQLEIHLLKSTDLDENSNILLETFRRVISENIIVTGDDTFQRQAIQKIKHFAEENEFSRHAVDTRWMLLLDSHVVQGVNITSLRLNNVLVLSHDKQNILLGLASLLWTHDGRVLFDVTRYITSGVTSSDLYPNEMRGLNGRELRVGINTWYSYIVPSNNNGTTTYRGFCIDLLEILAQSLNFSYRLVLPPDGEWGDKRNGHWTGLLGLIERKEVDLIGAPLSPILERKDIADWSTVPVDYFYMGLVFVDSRHAQNLSLWSSFLRPFTWQVYACALASFLCGVCCFRFLLWLEERQLGNDDQKTKQLSVGDVVYFLLGTVLNKAVHVSSNHQSSGVFVAAWCLLGLVLTSSYTCKLTSLFVDTPSPPPFTSMAELVTQNDFRWGTSGGTVMVYNLKTSTDPLKKTFYNKMMTSAKEDPDVLHVDPEVHLPKVLAGNYAFYTDKTTLLNWTAEHCEFSIVVDETATSTKSYNMYTPKDSALVERIDQAFFRLEASGVLSYLRQKWMPQSRSCHDNKSGPQTITMATLQGPCYVAIAGLLLSWGVLLLERKCYNQHRCVSF